MRLIGVWSVALAVVGVRLRDLSIPRILAILAVPVVLQAGAVVAYTLMIDTYGAVCC